MNHFEPIAITGIGGVFPGAADLDAFWANILERHTAAAEVPRERWPVDKARAFAHEIGKLDTTYSIRACLLKQRAWPLRLDPEALQLPQELIEALDPSAHLALYAGQQALDNARAWALPRTRMGVILGHLALPTESASAYAWQLLGEGRNPAVHPLNTQVAGLPAAVLGRALQLGGAVYTLDAACASSLYAIKLACDELHAHRADAMLAGGVSRPDCFYTQMGFSQLRALSPSGRSAPFDADADGLVVGEGAGIFVLRRLSDAVAGGEPILGVIRGIGLSNDIGGKLLAPSSEGQLRAMRAAYAAAGWRPDQVDLIECHATGTPVGDAVEFESLRALWSGSNPNERCVIGSVKSNVGHMLTAAGAAALTKVLFALREETLPPSANHTRTPDKFQLEASPFAVLHQPRPWTAPATHARRAAVSAFGFGGINAHVLVEAWEPARHTAPTAPRKPAPCKVAIIGLHAQTGTSRSGVSAALGSSALAQQLLFGTSLQTVSAAAEMDVPLNRFRIPPRELEEMLPQQVLALETALRAWEDARLDQEPRPDAGVYFGVALDLNTTNYHLRWMALEQAGRQYGQDAEEFGPPLTPNRVMGGLASVAASRIARELRCGGPSFVLASEERSGLNALQAAVQALQAQEVNVALVGAVDLPTDPRAAEALKALRPEATALVDAAVAFVLKRLDDARRDGDHVYAVIDEVHLGDSAQYTQQACTVRCLEEQTILCAFAPESRLGYTGACTGLLAVAAAVLCLDSAVLPGSLNDRTEQMHLAEPWLRNRAEGPRQAKVDGPDFRLVLRGSESASESREYRPPIQEALFSVHGNSPAALVEPLQALAAFVEHNNESLPTLAKRWWQRHKEAAAPCIAAMAARSDTELQAQIEALTHHLQTTPDKPFDATGDRPGGPLQDRVFYTPKPLAREGSIAFVFPGSGNQFAEMGRELLLHFPGVLAAQDAENQYLRAQYKPGRFWNVGTLEDMAEDHEALIFGQVALGTAVSDIARRLGIIPQAVVGYSLGETAGLFALRAWTARDEMLRRVANSRLFTHDLAGDCEAARRSWKLPKQEAVDWVLGVIDRPMKVAKSALANSKKVYPLIANTLQESVIGGNRGAVEKLIKTLQCQFIPLKGVTTVHCEVVKEVEQEYHDLHLFDTHAPRGIRFYSGAWGRSYEVTRESAAASILAQALEGVDYPRVIDAAYADGARIFLEMGPGNSCTRMISRILGDRPHVARALCHAGQDPWSIVLRAMAQLLAEGVPVKLDQIHRSAEEPRVTPGPIILVRSEAEKYCRKVIPAAPIPAPPPAASPVSPATAPARSVHEIPAGMPAPAPAPPAGTPPRNAVTTPRAANAVMAQWSAAEAAKAEAHAAFLRFSDSMHAVLAEALGQRMSLQGTASLPADAPTLVAQPAEVPKALNRAQCMEFAIGSIGRVLGPRFAEIDEHPTRVRLPDTPLMLVDRITLIEGEPCSLGSGRVVTEHDVLPGGWYLDGGRIPTCVAVEAGQADLFLSGYLGIDFETTGLAMYRLLDAEVTFHRGLPQPGQVIRYDIHIDRFFRHGNPWFFHFHFDAFVGEALLMTMRNGCAGFFTEAELAAGQGVVTPGIDRTPLQGKSPADWQPPVPLGQESYTAAQLDALRTGDLAACFTQAFAKLPLSQPLTLPGGPMRLVHRVIDLNPEGGRWGIGSIRAEADIHPDDWFITCHFVDDRVMPGTLMYECCLHTLRILLMRMGWLGETGSVAWEPVPGVSSRLKCRGQVLESTRVVTYEVTLKEFGFRPEPYCIADARMYADGKAIVDILDMSVQLTGQSREGLEQLWSPFIMSIPSMPSIATAPKPALFDEASILAFAEGKPSEAFGERYRVFDEQRRIARLPRPPYAFVSRITETQHPQWLMQAGGSVEGQYDIPMDAWYFDSNRHEEMPFAVLLEAVLQVCGWFSSYMGSALHSELDLKYRNLGGTCTQYLPVTRDTGLLTTTVKCTNVSHSGGMIIQNFDMEAWSPQGLVYRGSTYFGFFSPAALANQLGVREAQRYAPSEAEMATAQSFAYPTEAPFPDERLRMVAQVDLFVPQGGPQGLGFLRGSKRIDPEEWFFQAHFYQDPVWPGSLGLESFLQLLKVAAVARWGSAVRFETPTREAEHTWIYRGQVLPTQGQVQVEAVVTSIDDTTQTLTGEGFLIVDGLTIYQMKDFSVRAHPLEA